MRLSSKLAMLSASILTFAACGSDGPAGPAGPEGPPGPQGPPGAPGAGVDALDGGLDATTRRLYGDGHEGALTVGAGETLMLSGSSSGEYASITIATNGRLTVPSGTLLRTTGTFRNDGTIDVRPAAMSGLRNGGVAGGELGAVWPPHPGVAPGIAGFGSLDQTAPFASYGGLGAQGLGTAARWHTQLLSYAGGGGANSWPFVARAVPSGGGALHVRSKGELRNAGTIEAVGRTALTTVGGNCGCSGGGGGAVLLASATKIDNSGGVVDVRGGDGQPGDIQCGAGGGGGGGFVHLIAPVIAPGELRLDGGQAGASGTYGTLRWIGGSGGGGSAGNGGDGYGEEGSAIRDAQNGTRGLAFEITADPAEVL